jgi:formylglycine-generating enzyme required for sulfatase activity
MLVRVTVAIILLLWPCVLRAQAEKRIALLIGNRDYKPGVGALTNPLNDIRVVGDALKAVGFEVLKPTQNATRSAMLRAILEFAAKLKAAGPDAIGFLYYSGHGIASGGENYLVPVDVEEPSTMELNVQGVKQSEVLSILRGEAPNAAHYLVLDACRNTLRGTRGGKGFVPAGQQSGVLVAFATEPGKTASDLGPGSGPYAAALAAELVKPAQNDLLMFHNVRVAVMDKTNGDQVPWTEDGIQRRQRVQFGASAPAMLPSAEQVPVASSRLSEAAEAWGVVKDETNFGPLEAYIARYNDTFYAELARQRIQELKKVAPPTATGKLSCESYLGSSMCELDVNCAWSANTKQCQRKSGSPPTALLEAPPVAKPPSCVGIEVLVGHERRCLKPKDTFKDCAECPEMVVIPEGEFLMGSTAAEIGTVSSERPDLTKYFNWEAPQRQIKIARKLAIGRSHITRGEFSAFVVATNHKTEAGCYVRNGGEWKVDPSRNWRSPGFEQTDRHPVVCVSWIDANAYADWLSKLTGRKYRLLSEAEAEYAARATTRASQMPRYSFGNETKDLCAYGNGANRTGIVSLGWEPEQVAPCASGYIYTAPVASFSANAWGLYDVHGNAWSWTADCWNDTLEKVPADGSSQTTGDCALRVVRGGSWANGPRDLRSAARDNNRIGERTANLSFRLARDLID